MRPVSQSELSASKDTAQQIVEIVGYTARELANAFQPLVHKRRFLGKLDFRDIDTRTDVASESAVRCEAGNTVVQDPPVLSVRASHPVLQKRSESSIPGAPLELQISYLERLPQEYTGERHVVTVGRAADGTYRWEERRGAPPASEDSPKSIFRIFLVRAKDGGPDYSWPEDAQP